jgi:hypothetical protein
VIVGSRIALAILGQRPSKQDAKFVGKPESHQNKKRVKIWQGSQKKIRNKPTARHGRTVNYLRQVLIVGGIVRGRLRYAAQFLGKTSQKMPLRGKPLTTFLNGA